MTTGTASITMGAAGTNTLDISLAAGARSVADLINLFIRRWRRNHHLTVAELARLGLTTGADPAVAQDDDAITAAIQQDTPPQKTDPRIDGGSGLVDTGIRIKPDSAKDADGDNVQYRLKDGAFDNNLVELVDTDGDGTLEIRFKNGQRPDYESQRGERTDGNYKFVVEAVSKSPLAGQDKIKQLAEASAGTVIEEFLKLNGHIVNVTIQAAGQPIVVIAPNGNVTAVTAGKGTTLEQLFEAILGNSTLSGNLGLDATKPGAAKERLMEGVRAGTEGILDPEKVTEQVYEYNVTDADEAPWDLGITDRSLGERDGGNPVTTIGLITWTDDGTPASRNFGHQQDGGVRTGTKTERASMPQVQNSEGDDVPASHTVTLALTGHVLTITRVSWTDSSGARQELTDGAEIAKRFVLDADGQLVFVEEREIPAGDIDALRGDENGVRQDGTTDSLLKDLQDAFNALIGDDTDAANLDDGSGGGRLADLQAAYDAFVAANTALTNNADGSKGALEAAGDTLAAAVKVILDKVTGNTPAEKMTALGTVTQPEKDAVDPAITGVRNADTTVTATNRLGNGEVYDVTVSVADDAGNSSEQTIEVVQGTVFASGFAAIMDALATATEEWPASPMPASPSIRRWRRMRRTCLPGSIWPACRTMMPSRR